VDAHALWWRSLRGNLPPAASLRTIGSAYVTLVGSNPLFHLPQDRWPHAVDASAVARVAVASTRSPRREITLRLNQISRIDLVLCLTVSLLRACLLLCTEPAQPLGARESTASASATR
jgi:hypothetical protein